MSQRKPSAGRERQAVSRQARRCRCTAGFESSTPKSGKRRLVLMGIVASRLAAASYASTCLSGVFRLDDDAIARNNTMLGARVTANIAGSFRRQSLVHAAIIMKIETRLSIRHAARTRIPRRKPPRAYRRRSRRSKVRSRAQPTSFREAGEARGLDYDRQQR